MILHLESSEFAFTLEPDKDSPSVLGRDEACQCCVENDSVSRKHAQLNYVGGEWLIHDLGSRYGTMINGKTIKKPTALADGDVLKLADKNFVIRLSTSNEMEDLGAHLAGGKLRGLLKQASNTTKNTGKPLVKRKMPSKQTLLLPKEEGESGDDDDVKAAVIAEVPKPGEAEAETESPSPRAPKKTVRLRKKEAPKASKTVTMMKLLAAVVVIGVGAGFGYTYWQDQQAAAARSATKSPGVTPTPSLGDPEGAPTIRLPPKPATAAPKTEPATTDTAAIKPTDPPATTDAKP